jgi:hypothetical protein
LDKQVKYGFIFVLICVSLAVAEVNHGTLAVIYYTQDKIIVAADSRAIVGQAPPDDTQCKLSALDGKFLFVSAGLRGYVPNPVSDPVPKWSNQDLARIAYDNFRGFPAANVLESVASKCTELELANLDSMYFHHPRFILEAAKMGRGKITAAIFGGIDEGALKLFLVQISFDITRKPSIGVSINSYIKCPEKTGNFCTIGDSDIVREFLNKTSERARYESKTWKPDPKVTPQDRDIVRTMRLVELTILHQKERALPWGKSAKVVGGPIDAVELDRFGPPRWYRQKKNCPEN